jgi:hypothetical protein
LFNNISRYWYKKELVVSENVSYVVLFTICVLAWNVSDWIEKWKGRPAEEDWEPSDEEMFQLGYQTTAGHLLQGHPIDTLKEDLSHEWSTAFDNGITVAINAWKEKVKA